MKNKIIILSLLFLFRLFWSVDICHAVSVSDLYPAAAVYNAVTKTWSVPAAIEATSANGFARKVVATIVNPSTLGTLGIMLGAGAIYYGGSAAIDYFMAQAAPISYDSAGVMKKDTIIVCPDYACASASCNAAAAAYKVGRCTNGIGYCHSGNVQNFGSPPPAYVKCSAWGAGNNPPPYYFYRYYGYGTSNHDITNATSTDLTNAIQEGLDSADAAKRDAAIAAGNDLIFKTGSPFPSGVLSNGLSSPINSATLALIKAAYLAGVSAGDIAAAQAEADNMTLEQYLAAAAADRSGGVTAAQMSQILAGAGMTAAQIAAAVRAANPSATAAEIAASLASQGLTANQIAAAVRAANPSATAAEIAAAVRAANPAATAAEIAAAIASQGLTANNIADAIRTKNPSATAAEIAAAVRAANPAATAAEIAAAIAAANPELTKEQIKEAIEEAVPMPTEDVAVPTDTLPLVPDKLSLTAVLSSFMASINQLPMMQTLQGLTIQCSGSSQLCVALPANLGGTKCYDGGNLTEPLNMIGSAMLGLTTIFSFLYVFKG